MCGRYTIIEPEGLEQRFNLSIGDKIRPNYNAAPSQTLPVITNTAEGKHLELMRWGFLPVWAKDPKIGYKLINARSESVFDKPMWKRAISGSRCLIPATGFYEWKAEQGGKQPFYIHPKALPIFSFAGVWSSWHDPSGQEVHTYSILTTEPNAEMAGIHDRMPVILHPEDEDDWLNPDLSEQQDIERYLRPLEDNALETFPVSKAVNVVKTNVETLVLPINSQ